MVAGSRGQHTADLAADAAAVEVLVGGGLGVLSEESGLTRPDRPLAGRARSAGRLQQRRAGPAVVRLLASACSTTRARGWPLVINLASGVELPGRPGRGARGGGEARLAPTAGAAMAVGEAFVGLSGLPPGMARVGASSGRWAPPPWTCARWPRGRSTAGWTAARRRTGVGLPGWDARVPGGRGGRGGRCTAGTWSCATPGPGARPIAAGTRPRWPRRWPPGGPSRLTRTLGRCGAGSCAGPAGVYRRCPFSGARWVVRAIAPSVTVGAMAIIERRGEGCSPPQLRAGGGRLPGGLEKRAAGDPGGVAACDGRSTGRTIGIEVDRLLGRRSPAGWSGRPAVEPRSRRRVRSSAGRLRE